MKIKVDKPYLISWLTIPFFIFLGFAYRQHSASIQLHDTYYVFSIYHVALLSGLLLGLIGLGYWIAIRRGKKPRRVLSLVHLCSTICILATLTFSDAVFKITLDAGFIFILLLILLVAQLVYLATTFHS